MARTSAMQSYDGRNLSPTDPRDCDHPDIYLKIFTVDSLILRQLRCVECDKAFGGAG